MNFICKIEYFIPLCHCAGGLEGPFGACHTPSCCMSCCGMFLIPCNVLFFWPFGIFSCHFLAEMCAKMFACRAQLVCVWQCVYVCVCAFHVA